MQARVRLAPSSSRAKKSSSTSASQTVVLLKPSGEIHVSPPNGLSRCDVEVTIQPRWRPSSLTTAAFLQPVLELLRRSFSTPPKETARPLGGSSYRHKHPTRKRVFVWVIDRILLCYAWCLLAVFYI